MGGSSGIAEGEVDLGHKGVSGGASVCELREVKVEVHPVYFAIPLQHPIKFALSNGLSLVYSSVLTPVSEPGTPGILKSVPTTLIALFQYDIFASVYFPALKSASPFLLHDKREGRVSCQCRDR